MTLEFGWLIAGAVLPSLAVCWAAAWVVRRFGPRFGLVDRPGGRKIHRQPMPTAGGLAIWLGVVLPLAAGYLVLWLAGPGNWGAARAVVDMLPEALTVHIPGLLHQAPKLWIMLAGGTVLMLLGLADDRRGVPWPIRLAVQIVVALVMVQLGWTVTLVPDMPPVNALIAVVWIVGLVNSMNMLDNMDGLAAGVATIAAGMLAAAMLLYPDPVTNQPQLFVGGLLLVMVGSLLGFLGHNFHPARLFMGDAGSYLIGYLLAMATLSATFGGSHLPSHAVLAPLCVLAVPIYDTTTVVIIRIRQGRSPFTGDKSHFSHRLVDLGMSPVRAVLTIYLAAATCGLGALLLHQVDAVGACIILLLVGCTLVLVAILETAARRTKKKK